MYGAGSIGLGRGAGRESPSESYVYPLEVDQGPARVWQRSRGGGCRGYKFLCDVLPSAVEACRDRGFACAERASGVAIGQAEEVHRNHSISVLARRAGDCLHDLGRGELALVAVRDVVFG